MGNGKFDDLTDIVYIKPSAFTPARTREMTETLGTLNDEFERNDGGYVLITVGRLGSSDPWLGLPTTWNQISSARVIVETGLENFQVEPSQGTHFFQNLTSLRNCYMTINPSRNDGTLDLDTLEKLPAVFENEFIRHVQTEKTLEIVVDGKSGRGYIGNTE